MYEVKLPTFDSNRKEVALNVDDLPIVSDKNVSKPQEYSRNICSAILISQLYCYEPINKEMDNWFFKSKLTDFDAFDFKRIVNIPMFIPTDQNNNNDEIGKIVFIPKETYFPNQGYDLKKCIIDLLKDDTNQVQYTHLVVSNNPQMKLKLEEHLKTASIGGTKMNTMIKSIDCKTFKDLVFKQHSQNIKKQHHEQKNNYINQSFNQQLPFPIPKYNNHSQYTWNNNFNNHINTTNNQRSKLCCFKPARQHSYSIEYMWNN